MITYEFVEVLKTKNKEKILYYIKQNANFNFFHGEVEIWLGSVRNLVCHLDYLIEWFIYRLDEVGESQFLMELNKFFLAPDPIPVVHILALSGIEIDMAVDITSDIKLVPYKDLPDSRTKVCFNPSYSSEKFLKALNKIDKTVLSAFREFTIFPPEVIKSHSELCMRMSLGPYIDLSIPTAALVSSKNLYEKFNEICWCMHLLDDCSPRRVASWCDAEEWVPYFSLYGGGGSSSPIYDDMNRSSKKLVIEEIEIIKKIYPKFSRLSSEIKIKLNIAFDRVCRASYKNENESKVIDIGIALESLFLEKKDKKRKTSKLKRRVEFFFHEEKSMCEFSKLVGRLYDYRSQAVHNGKLDTKYSEKLDKQEILRSDIAQGIKLIRSTIMRIVNEGKFPKWDSIEEEDCLHDAIECISCDKSVEKLVSESMDVRERIDSLLRKSEEVLR